LPNYKIRIADKILKRKLEAKGAVFIEGAKWCRKTTTASQIAKLAKQGIAEVGYEKFKQKIISSYDE